MCTYMCTYYRIYCVLFNLYTLGRIMAITESWLKSKLNKKTDKVSVHSDRDGMSLRITPKGKIIFQMR